MLDCVVQLLDMHRTVAMSGFGLGSWWRFAEYEIAGGYIRPAPGAAIEEYDPWELYSLAQESRGKIQPPYQSLLELENDLRGVKQTRLEPEARAKVIRWCESYGLLGLLLHRVNKVAFAPRWDSWGELDPDTGNETDFAGPRYREFRWIGGRWIGDVIPVPPESKGLPGELVPPNDSSPSASVQVQDEAMAWHDEPIDRTWTRYFPGVPEEDRTTYQYPKPLTEEFWRIYAEPVEDFLRYVGTLEGALLIAKAAKILQKHGREFESSFEPEEFKDFLRALTSLTSRVSPTLDLADDGSFQQVWCSPSLLASLATMATFDIGGSQRVLKCDTCKRPFVTPAYQAKYCSDRCRNTAQKRRTRAKKKRAAQASKSKGGPND